MSKRKGLLSLGAFTGHHVVAWRRLPACDVVNYGADGFNIMSPNLPDEPVLPELRWRGLFSTGYDGTTLRDHLGLKRPAGRFAGQAEAAE